MKVDWKMAGDSIWGTKDFQVPEYFNFADVIDEWAQKEKVKKTSGLAFQRRFSLTQSKFIENLHYASLYIDIYKPASLAERQV